MLRHFQRGPKVSYKLSRSALCRASLLVFAAALARSQTGRPSDIRLPDGPGDRYLMLVNTARSAQMDSLKLGQFDRSPYDALAVSFEDAYGAAPVLPPALMQPQIAGWKRATSKAIWPWVYLNRVIGANAEEGNPLTNVPYFEGFQGLDLDDAAGAQSDFLKIWSNALQLARATGVPGIVCDLEFYNNYKAYGIAELSIR